MNYVILEKARPYTRTRRGHLERVKGYTGRIASPEKVYHGTSARNVYKILFEGVKPQNYHNFKPDYFEGDRAKKIFVVTAFASAAVFAFIAEEQQGKPAIVIEAMIPTNYWKSNAKDDDRFGGGYAFELPEIKPEWITNVYDHERKPMTSVIDSLRLERFEKSGKLVYIPVTLAVLKKIFKEEKK
jgi:hypothetical protein